MFTPRRLHDCLYKMVIFSKTYFSIVRKTAILIYWLFVLSIPLLVWWGGNEYGEVMQHYEMKPGVIVSNDFEFLFDTFFKYTLLLLWPLGIRFIILEFRNKEKRD